ncbi:glutamate 5-kinase [Alkalicoccus luteus]|uniref:Glutamate 5-kinase n=1 Tax=Alkalicoccus luteus TaxID=1237094 RepID=A0A969PN52_9BACI|nr:glutamate 5-kinase [Alkalicoccus luteus]NJP37280.1 glutamate 5-kinase [Alkalicoccus luteus]
MKRKRIVIKIGSSSLTEEDGTLSPVKMAAFCHAIAGLRQKGHELLIVSSGAVAAGFRDIGYAARPTTVRARQAAAAAGQALLMQHYRFQLQHYRIIPAQLLVTRSDFSEEKHFQNLHAAIEELLSRKILPIINENDSTAVDELTFGDNDMLSALVGGALHADLLMLLTDADGVYSADPREDPEAVKYKELHTIPEELLQAPSRSTLGTGGIGTKLLASRAAADTGVEAYIGTLSSTEDLLQACEGSGSGTYIRTQSGRVMRTRRQWIAYHASASGVLFIDDGAKEAVLNRGASLLTVGISKTEGTFFRGDIVDVYAGAHKIGRGRVLVDHTELSGAIVESSIAVHRDEWVSLN